VEVLFQALLMAWPNLLHISDNVFIEGIPAVRQTDKMVSNNKNTSPMPLMQPPAGPPQDVADEGPVALEAAELTDHGDWEVINTESINIKAQISSVDISDAE